MSKPGERSLANADQASTESLLSGCIGRQSLSLLLAVLLLLGGTATPVLAGPAPDAPTDPTSSSVADTDGVWATTAQTGDAPPDPDKDVLGWENGYWYNESLDIDTSDGLNASELEAVLARTMARVERLRELEFKRTPNVRFVTREEYQAYIDSRFERLNATDDDRLHQNTKFEALFLVGEEKSYYQVARENQASFAAAFYFSETPENSTFSEGDLGIVIDEEGVAQLNEPVLAHELVHALQNQHFDLSEVREEYNVQTEEDNLAYLGLIEGDADNLQTEYQLQCGVEWDSCVTADRTGGSPSFADLGLIVYQLVPYREGPALVEAVREEGGWEAVNALYENLPESTEQVIHPDKYQSDPPTTVTVEDRSSADWYVPNTTGGVDYATFGEAGIFVMFWAPGSLREIPTTFNDTPSEGWDGDRLVPYATNDSTATNETGYVWKIVWDSPEDAREFAAAYREKLQSLGARNVSNAANTYILKESRSEAFGDAFALRVQGNVTVIVNAPTVAELNEIRAGVVADDARTPTPTPESEGTTREPTTATPTSEDGSSPPSPSETDASTTTGAGLGLVTAIVALLAAMVLARHRN